MTMKLIATLIFAFLLVGCRTADRDLEPSIFVQNLKGPFISEQFAERLGSLVIDPRDRGKISERCVLSARTPNGR